MSLHRKRGLAPVLTALFAVCVIGGILLVFAHRMENVVHDLAYGKVPDEVFGVYKNSMVGVEASIIGEVSGVTIVQTVSSGMGSAVAEGYVLTNFHVIGIDGGLFLGSSRLPSRVLIRVVDEGHVYGARVVAIDAWHDLALLQVIDYSGRFRKQPITFQYSPGPQKSSNKKFWSFRDAYGLRNFTEHAGIAGYGWNMVLRGDAKVFLGADVQWLGSLYGIAAPGFSGSPVVDKDGRCWGIVVAGSATLGRFFPRTSFVPSEQILNFLAKSGLRLRILNQPNYQNSAPRP